MHSSLVAIFLVSCLLVSATSAFQVAQLPSQQRQSSTTSLNFFGDAFKNEDMGKVQNAGLSGGPAYNENVTVNGKPVKGAVVGQKLTVVAGKARVKIPVNCQKGDCGTCVVNVNGRKVKACQTSLGKGKTSIQV